MGRNTSKNVSAKVSTVSDNSSKKVTNMNASNVATLSRPVATRIALEACQYAYEACTYPVEYSNTFPAPGFLFNIASAGPVVYNPRYMPATPFPVKVPASPAPVVQDLLAPYFGKSVTLAYHVGIDPATGKNIEMGFDTVDGSAARAIATANAKKHNLPVVIRCAENGALVYTQGKEVTSKGTSVARVTSGATVKTAKGATPEEIAAREEAARVKAEEAAAAAKAKAEQEAAAAAAKAAKAAAAARAKQIAENAKNAAKVLKATRTAPDAGTDNAAIFESLKKDIGATCKELNFEHDERNGNPYGTSNRGWKQIAVKLALTCNQEIYQSVRVCNRTTSVNILLMPAFKLVSKGENAGPGWTNITPAS